MWWHYLIVFGGTLLVDVVPFPLPPAFTLMVLMQIAFTLNIWVVIPIGVLGSAIGRYLLSLYIPWLSEKVFNPERNEDVQYLGEKMKEKGWRSHALILVYSLMPLPTTPLFIAGGMAKMKPYQIIPPFVLGKLISDTVAVLMGMHAVGTVGELLHGLISWKSLTGILLGLLLIIAFLVFDWRALLQRKQVKLNFTIWK